MYLCGCSSNGNFHKTDDLIWFGLTGAMESKPSDDQTTGPVRSRIGYDGREFTERATGRRVTLRGVSVSGRSKTPADGGEFYEDEGVTFEGHPLELGRAEEYLGALVGWGINLVRLVVCWEALEHAGPGLYDLGYIDYLRELVRRCQARGLLVLLDAHQDVWSRFAGGDGAPGWTLRLAGFHIPNLLPTHAAAVHQHPRPGVWPTGYQKLSAATMFTLFFAGDTFAPLRKVKRKLHAAWRTAENCEELVSLQEFFQFSMVEAFGKLADALAPFDCVIGFEPMNEPHRGLINLHSPHQWNSRTDLFLHECPSFLEAVALGEGHSQRVDVYTPIWPVPSFRFHRRRISPQVRAWQAGVECVWKQHGVWKWDEARRKPVILQPKYFNLDPDGAPYDFYARFFFPFVRKFASRVQQLRPDWLIPVGPIPNEFYPQWDLAQRPRNLVAAPHFYDLFSLVHKAHGSLTMDVQAICMNKPIWKWLHFGHSGAKKNYTGQIRNIVGSVYKNLGEVPCLVGEVGICMDLNRAEAFKTGNFYWQHHQMDALLTALESNLVSYVLWNFNPYNSDEIGDGWNGENFSFISRSAGDDSDVTSQARILSAIVRPYAQKVSGIPVRSKYESETSVFEFEYKNTGPAGGQEDEKRAEWGKTEIFLPRERFPQGGTRIVVSDGTYEHDASNQSLVWTHANNDPAFVHRIRVDGRPLPVHPSCQPPPLHRLLALFPSLSILTWASLGVALVSFLWLVLNR